MTKEEIWKKLATEVKLNPEPCTRYGIASPHMHWKPEQMYSTLSSLWGIPVFHPKHIFGNTTLLCV